MSHAARAEPRRRLRIPGWLEFIILVVAAVLVAICIKAFFVQMFFVPSTSMTPLFQINDRILVQKVSYWAGDVERGDVIVFRDPYDEWLGVDPTDLNPVQRGLAAIGLYPTGGHLTKRVIGVAGDRVVCCDDNGRITVNGIALDEGDYILEGTSPSDQEFDVTVPQDRLWVMGDNRDNSEDSRFHTDVDGGFVPTENVVGKVWAVVWPLGHFQRLHTPETFKALEAASR